MTTIKNTRDLLNHFAKKNGGCVYIGFPNPEECGCVEVKDASNDSIFHECFDACDDVWDVIDRALLEVYDVEWED